MYFEGSDGYGFEEGANVVEAGDLVPLHFGHFEDAVFEDGGLDLVDYGVEVGLCDEVACFEHVAECGHLLVVQTLVHLPYVVIPRETAEFVDVAAYEAVGALCYGSEVDVREGAFGSEDLAQDVISLR